MGIEQIRPANEHYAAYDRESKSHFPPRVTLLGVPISLRIAIHIERLTDKLTGAPKARPVERVVGPGEKSADREQTLGLAERATLRQEQVGSLRDDLHAHRC